MKGSLVSTSATHGETYQARPEPPGQLLTAPSAVRVGVVGCGFQGQTHIKAFSAMERVEVAAIADIDAARLVEVGDTFDVEARFDEVGGLLDLGLDLISICTMPNSHAPLVCAAAQSGAHVMCEKPFARSVEEAVTMVSAAERADRLLAVGFNTRYLSSSSAVRDFIDRGSLGEIVCARGFAYLADVPWWGKHYVRELAGGGVLSSVAVHMVDLLMWIAGNPRPLTATASMAKVFPRKRAANAPAGATEAYDVEDVAFGHVRCEGGFWFTIESTWLNDRGPAMVYSFDAYGSAGQAHLVPLELYAEKDGGVQRVDDGGSTELDLESSFVSELEDVVAAVRTGELPERLGTGRQALTVQAVTDALYRSAREGREVEVEVPSV
jgi:predicted dehydrogenase